jgi:hypothetical protein
MPSGENPGPLAMFGNFGIVGGYDAAPNPIQDDQMSINWYPEIDPGNSKEVLGLLGSPGLTQLAVAPVAGAGAPGFTNTQTVWPMPYSGPALPVRGFWELPANEDTGGAGATVDSTALVVIGNTCYLITATQTSNTWPTLSLKAVGTLLTSSGPVCIRDNNQGNTAVIVDGPYGYYYTITTQKFAQITDPNFLGADTVAYIDGWWIFNKPGTQEFYSNAEEYGLTFSALFFALKDAASDNLVAVMENKELLWLIGDKTTEVWYNAPIATGGVGATFAFQRIVGTLIQAGCKAKHSVSRFGTQGQEGLMWFGRSERGENVIILTQGFQDTVVSTPSFGKEVATYPVTDDATAYTYQEDTHEFYVLTFPTADVTWVYDGQSGLLHKRASYDPYAKAFHRERSNCYMNFAGMRITGDYENGAIYWLTRNSYTDAGWPLLAKRRAPHVWDKGQRGRVFMQNLQLDFNVGQAPASGMGSNPQCKLHLSRDGGHTFGDPLYAPMGQIGQYRTRTMWRKLGWGRDNVVDIEVIDPVNRDLVGATLKAFSAA